MNKVTVIFGKFPGGYRCCFRRFEKGLIPPCYQCSDKIACQYIVIETVYEMRILDIVKNEILVIDFIEDANE